MKMGICSCYVLINAFGRKDRQMEEKKKLKGKKALTDGLDFGDTRETTKAHLRVPASDPRIIALVRMLARNAAERDYLHLVRRNGALKGLPEEE